MRTADIAKRFGIPETDLRSLNQIPPSMLVKAGLHLLVPRASAHQTEVPEHLADNGQVQASLKWCASVAQPKPARVKPWPAWPAA